MKIAFCGVPTIGKTALIGEFLKKWPKYVKPVPNSNLYNEESRYNIENLDRIMDECVNKAMFADGVPDVVHDGCIIDAFAHILLFFSMHPEAKTDILAKYYALVYNAIQFYDAIFYMPFSTKYRRDVVEMTKDEFLYIAKLESFYQAIYKAWEKGDNDIFPFREKNGCPPIIEVYGKTLNDQIELLNLYINKDGDPVPPQQKPEQKKESNKETTENGK